MSTAQPNAIRIPVVMELDAATGQLKGLRRVAATETKAAADDVARNLGSAERAATASAGNVSKSFKTWKDELRGVNPAITSATQAFALLGAKGHPAVAGLSHALASLASGASGVGIVIGLAAGAVGTLIGQAEAATPVLDGLRDRLDSIGEANAKLRLAQEAKRTGVSEGEIETLRQIEIAQDRINARLRERITAEARLEQIAADLPGRNLAFADIATLAEVSRLRDTIAAARRELPTDESTLAGLKQHLDLVRGTTDAWREQLAVIQRAGEYERSLSSPGFVQRARERSGNPALAGALDGLSVYQGGEVEQRSLPSLLSAWDGRLRNMEERLLAPDRRPTWWGTIDAPDYEAGFAGIDARSAADEERARRMAAAADQYGAWRGIFGDVAGIDIGTEQSAAQDAALREASEAAGRQFSGAITSGVTGAFLQLSKDRDLGGFLVHLSTSISDTMLNAVLNGLVRASGLEKASEDVGRAIFDMFSSSASSVAAGTASTGGTGTAPQAPSSFGGDTIVVVNTFSEADADAFAAKMTTRGARAVVAKHGGRGVTAGSIPSRRGR